jgi:hypothetical protein
MKDMKNVYSSKEWHFYKSVIENLRPIQLCGFEIFLSYPILTDFVELS